jgi:hypothetical protein
VQAHLSGATETQEARRAERTAGLADAELRRGHQLGSSTVSMTWITPFDCITFLMVILAASPLAS